MKERMHVKVVMDIISGHNVKSALVLGKACKNAGMHKATVYFRNSYHAAVVEIWGFSTEPSDPEYEKKAMGIICYLADQHGIKLIVDAASCSRQKNAMRFYEDFGFRMIGSRTLQREIQFSFA